MFHNDRTLTKITLNLLHQKFKLSRMDERMDGQTDRQRVRPYIRQKKLNNDVMMILCVKFHQDQTSTPLNTTLTKNVNLSEMEWTDK